MSGTDNYELPDRHAAPMKSGMEIMMQIAPTIGEIIASFEAQLAERDKTILEQQALLESGWPSPYPNKNVEPIDQHRWAFPQVHKLPYAGKAALEAHDREVRIKCLEDAANKACNVHCLTSYDLRGMANELKEQS